MIARTARRTIIAFLVLVGPLVVVACGGDESLPADQVISKASAAIASANSFHFLFEATKPEKPQPGLFVSKADGSAQKPDRLMATVDATLAGFPVQVQAIVDGQNQYMTDPVTGRWSKQTSEFNVTQYFDPSKGASDILSKVKNPTSDGKESIDGTDCYRIKGAVPASALQSLSPDISAKNDLNSTLWIGSSDFLLRRVRLEGPLSATEQAAMLRTITFSDYNKEVKIETPVIK